ncbi:hypothetical protein [Deinococcus maricopensis]|uniref:Lipoprotein n=1 Tax=Deinococcus maricopensis (strain DSM 21211 / LMG 22137 / NRRL B-23946 / LB-34) TaxID=709986 RepID=E8U7W7_DEIML|nr:hypothetical protein [Deinococcus maricopensis]ADV67156.1 hypothetical protein Deima_1507 [Deinococcus maricopensis DSM 21211]
MRLPLAALALLTLTACAPDRAVIHREVPTTSELAAILGNVQTLAVRPPPGARSVLLSSGIGGPLKDADLPGGALRVTVGVSGLDCPDGGRNVRVVGPFGSSGTCVPMTPSFGLQPLHDGRTTPLPLNRWVPMAALQPTVARGLGVVSDPDPAHWHLVSVYFSDAPNIHADAVPDASTAAQTLK